MAAKKEKFIIIDGNALVHRSFHALPPLTTSKGEQVNAVFGFASVLLKVMKDLKPTHIVASFDLAAPTFRHKEFKAYKAHRVKAPQELYDQIPRVKDVVRAFNIPIFEQEGFEADDIIGTVTAKLAGRPIDVIIVTGDMDTLQLVTDQTKVLTLKQGVGETVLLGPEQVREKYSLNPDQMIDYKALRGDPSDNIPGVPGIGEKTAKELLTMFGTVDALYAALEKNSPKIKKIKARVVELLTKHKKEAELSRKLATIVRTVPIDFVLSEAKASDYDREKVIAMFQELEFRSLLAKLPTMTLFLHAEKGAAATPTQGPKSAAKYTLIDADDAFEDFLEKLAAQKRFAFDTETTGLDTMTAKLLGASFSWKEGEGFYLNLNHKRRAAWLKKLQPILEDPKIEKCGHNLKFDYQMFRGEDISVGPLVFDSMIASYLLNAGSRQHSLDALAFSEFGYEMMPITELIGPKGKEQISMADVPLDKLSWYACEDADYTWRLCAKLEKELASHGVQSVFEKIEMPLIPVLAGVERTGVKIDADFLGSMSKNIGKRLTVLEKKIHDLAGAPFNIQSPVQLKKVLFEKLEISTHGISKTKTGLSTAAAELEKLKDVHPIINLLMEYREMSKLKSTYLDALPLLVNGNTGRVHTDYNQTIAATGRLSSINPNLQNIPTRTELGNEIRKSFIADRGFRLLSADYSQLELRIAAALAGDKKMLEAFRKGEDIHTRTAAEINDVPVDKVTKEMRHGAKEVNFGILYGMGVYGLASRTGISREQAKAFIEKYFSAYKELAAWIEETKEIARKRGYVETIFGRRRYVPDINARNMQVRNAAERIAVNMPIQGTEADLIKLAMITIAEGLPTVSPKSRMLMQVHDELVFEVPTGEIDTVAAYVTETMENVEKLNVPIVVEASVGANWGEMEAIE